MKRILFLAILLAAIATLPSPARAAASKRPAPPSASDASAEIAGGGTVADAPAVSLETLFGSDLLDHEGNPADLSVLSGKVVAIYFSASWCPPCRAFTPRLVDIADKLRAAGKPFELVLVGCDQSKEKAIGYMTSHEMTGYLIAPEADANEALSKRYKVHGIPYLVVVDTEGRTVDPAARATVQSSQGDADAVWAKWSR